jgi:hypothetical protein
MSPNKQHLLHLEETGQYVFHGSSNEVEVFEPRQAYTWHKGYKEKDGEPAIFASHSVDYAIFMAVVSRKNCTGNYHAGVATTAKTAGSKEYNLKFKVLRETLDTFKKDAKGWVYVFKKEDFPTPNGPSECVAYSHVTPLEKIVVTPEDLPEDIQIVEEVPHYTEV